MENKTMKNIAYSGVFAGALLGAYLMGERSANNQPSSYENRHQAVEKTKDSNYLEEKVSSKEEKPYSEPEDEPSFARLNKETKKPTSIRGLDSLLDQENPKGKTSFSHLEYITDEYGKKSFQLENDDGDRLILMKNALDEDGYLKAISRHDGMIGNEEFSENIGDYEFNGVVKINKKGIVLKDKDSGVEYKNFRVRSARDDNKESYILFQEDGFELLGTYVLKMDEYFVRPEDPNKAFKVVLGDDWSYFSEDDDLLKELSTSNTSNKSLDNKVLPNIDLSERKPGVAISTKDTNKKRNLLSNTNKIDATVVVNSGLNRMYFNSDSEKTLSLKMNPSSTDEHSGLKFGGKDKIEKFGDNKFEQEIKKVYSIDKEKRLSLVNLPDYDITTKKEIKDKTNKETPDFKKFASDTLFMLYVLGSAYDAEHEAGDGSFYGDLKQMQQEIREELRKEVKENK